MLMVSDEVQLMKIRYVGGFCMIFKCPSKLAMLRAKSLATLDCNKFGVGHAPPSVELCGFWLMAGSAPFSLTEARALLLWGVVGRPWVL